MLTRKRTCCSAFFIDAFTLWRKFSIECISDLIAPAKSVLCCSSQIHSLAPSSRTHNTPSSLCTFAAYAPWRRSVDRFRPDRIRPKIQSFLLFFQQTNKLTAFSWCSQPFASSGSLVPLVYCICASSSCLFACMMPQGGEKSLRFRNAHRQCASALSRLCTPAVGRKDAAHR